MLSNGFNVVGFNWIASSAATELENIVMDWLGKMLMLPKSFLFSGGGGGVMQGTTCEAMLCTLTATRDQTLSQIRRENIGKLVVYASNQTHFALKKASQIAGINPMNFRVITTTKSTAFELSPKALRSAILSDIEAGLVPLFLCATVGTTSSTAVDPLGPLCDVAKDYGIWVKDPNALIKALSTNPEYLRNKATESKQVVDYKDWQMALSKWFRAMKLWLVLRSCGISNLRNLIRSHINMAKHFEELIGMAKRFEVVEPRHFAMVCFRVSASTMGKDEKYCSSNELNGKLLESSNASRRVYMSHAMIGGVYVIRFAVGATLTNYGHVTMALKVV
ncbi:hypothetical protein F0562_018062 [Nyssa sinensis]|uniref:Tyrosine decarboxylase n=1 Tax=Nyssa sinensis TaxID=561372 RepID=A0A5J4Z884_9ASTE|nr:hypothetical protein F0562_018062 [Nyssa sinensis]